VWQIDIIDICHTFHFYHLGHTKTGENFKKKFRKQAFLPKSHVVKFD
jgi:hypothetical protein